ncbi:quinoprotein relay system zinc metallohydrolase 1 [Thauera sp. Sel9]|uniref:quinoprotein relay system zinc metallohydrolase 1 n=1 Tax=Thauera sp. Sel9 TaxID=2974299 RepID=UPI0021E14E75|nr:quinoprotein relay system zinc metallohydrolase 1 [Thauera sp. Sel9]MCV2219425.1 quinoprotein relay system zinc metallohydrolase 1 [Thauera sp. Sel9]
MIGSRLPVRRRSSRVAIATALAALALFAGLPAASSPAAAQQTSFDYRLAPQRIADGVYVLIGSTEDFSPANGGNIVNAGFIVGSEGVIVIDSGPSLRYGEQLRRAIAAVTPLPVVLVINTHHHPDHVLGNQAFPPATLAALPGTRSALETEGEALLENMYRLTGEWMRGTETVLPGRALAAGPLEIGRRRLELFVLAGHTDADLAVLDVATGTLFAGDIVFWNRAPTTPHADIAQWLQALERLERVPFKQLVPGHGPVATDATPIAQTRSYLAWLERTLREGAEQGLDMTEMLEQEVPPRFGTLDGAAAEFRRSVIHLYPAAERAALRSR